LVVRRLILATRSSIPSSVWIPSRA
jgi:hypothetical protein